MTTSSPAKRQSRPSINLSDLLSNPEQLEKLQFSRPEAPDEREARLQLQRAKATAQLIKETVIFAAGVIGVVVIAWVCVVIIRDANTSVDDKKWAQTILAGIITSIVGYLIGKSHAN